MISCMHLFFLTLCFAVTIPAIDANQITPAARQAYREACEAYKSQDFINSKKLFKEAATRGHPEAYYYLGRMVEQGLGFDKNIKRAYVLYLKGIEKGSKRSKRRVQQIKTQRLKKKKGQDDKPRILPDWEVEEEALSLIDALDNVSNPRPEKLKNFVSLFSEIDERHIGKNLPDSKLIETGFIEALDAHKNSMTPDTWLPICDFKSRFSTIKSAEFVCGRNANLYWQIRNQMNFKVDPLQILENLKFALTSDLSKSSKVELLTRYSIYEEFEPASQRIREAFQMLVGARYSSAVIEAFVEALVHHERPEESLEVMDFGRDLYAAAYFKSALGFLKNGEVGRAQIMYRYAGGKVAYNQARPLAFEYCWQMFESGYQKRGIQQLKELLIQSDSFTPVDWMKLASLMYEDHFYRKDAQIAFEKGLKWQPNKNTLPADIILGRASQLRFLERWGVKGPLKSIKYLE